MPIIGLTDHTTNVTEGLPRIGKLRKGDEKRTVVKNGKEKEIVGNDLDYFRFTPEPQFLMWSDTFTNLYGKKPDTFDRVYVVGDSVDDVFPTWLEWWGNGETLKIRTDGKTVVREYIDNKREYIDSMRPIMPNELANCKEVGRINLIMPELIQAIGTLGVVTVETHSKHDIITLHKYLNSILQMYGKLTGVPFTFGRVNKKVSVPGSNGRFLQQKSLFTIDVDSDFTRNVLLPGVDAALQAAPAVPQITARQEPDIIVNTEEINLLTGEITEVKEAKRKNQSDQPRRLTSGTSALKTEPENEPDITEVEPDDLPPEEYKGKLQQVRHATETNGKPLRFVTDTGQTFNVFDSVLFKDAGYDTSGWRTDDPKKTFDIDIEVGYIQNDKGYWEITKVITPAPMPEDDVKEAELAESDDSDSAAKK